MWVQEIFVDEFDGGGGLSLQHLVPSLNVIRVESPSNSSSLSQFIPSLLYGQSSIEGASQAGSLQVAQATRAGQWEILDLSRLPLDHDGRLSDLQILAEGGQAVDSERILETLEAIDAAVFRAVYTDEQSVLDRLFQWCHADWIVPLLRGARESGKSVDDDAPVADATIAHKAKSDARSLEHLRAQRNVSLLLSAFRQLTSEEADEGRAPATRAPELDSARETYLRAKHWGAARRDEIRLAREKLQVDEATLALIDRAVALQPIVKRQTSLASRLAANRAMAIDLRDVRQIRDISGKLESLRRQLQASRASLERKIEPSKRQHEASLKLLKGLRAQWPTCRDHQRRYRALRQHFSQLEANRAEWHVDRDDAEMVRAIGQIHRAAQKMRSTRLALGRTGEVAGSNDATEDFRVDPRVERLHRQIRQLRSETKRMLQRQLLSRPALVGIGLLFSAGVAILVLSLLLNLDGDELATGAIGFTCMLAAALLKSSFERTPTSLLHHQRQRVSALLAEVSRIRQADGVVSCREEESVPCSDSSDIGGAVAEHRRAKKAWLKLLGKHRLATSLAPRAAVQQLRSRWTKRQNSVADGVATPVDGILEHQVEIAGWCQQVQTILKAGDQAVAQNDVSTPSSSAARRRRQVDSPQECLRRLQRRIDQLQSQSHLTDATRAYGELAGVRREIRQLKQQRRELLRRNHVDHYSELRKRLKAQERCDRWEAEQLRLQSKAEALLPEEPDRSRVVDWLETSCNLENMRKKQLAVIAQLQQEITEAQRGLIEDEATIARFARERSGGTLSRPDRSTAVPDGFTDLVALVLAGAVLTSIETSNKRSSPAKERSGAKDASKDRQPLLLRIATQGLRMLWNDPTPRVVWDEAERGPTITLSDGSALTMDRLTAVQQHALVISLQCALVQCLSQRIGHLPFIVTDRSFPPNADASLTARMLHTLAARGQQVFVVTCREEVNAQFRNLNVPTLVITRELPAGRKRPGTERGSVGAGRMSIVQSPTSSPSESIKRSFQLFPLDRQGTNLTTTAPEKNDGS